MDKSICKKRINAKIKEIIIQIGYALVTVLIIVGIYAISWLTKGPLTTVESCTGSYIFGDYGVKDVKKNCPNLTKEEFKKSVNDYFDTYGGEKASTTREAMLREIEDKF